MDLVLNGMEELNEQELMMVDGGKIKSFKSKDWLNLAVGVTLAAAALSGQGVWTVIGKDGTRYVVGALL